MDIDEYDDLPDLITVEDESAKVFTCSCGWRSELFDWNNDDTMNEARGETLRHLRDEH